MDVSTCAICGTRLGRNRDGAIPLQALHDHNGIRQAELDDEIDPLDPMNPEVEQSSYTLGCGHQFHGACIQGWCMIGKRDTCPYW